MASGMAPTSSVSMPFKERFHHSVYPFSSQALSQMSDTWAAEQCWTEMGSVTACLCHAMQGVRTFVATNYNLTEGNRTANAAHNETYAYYPDDAPLHSLALKGDSRAALVPFLAHEYAHRIRLQ